MQQKRILVPVGSSFKDLKGVHYALSLAERLATQVFILQQSEIEGEGEPHSIWLNEALKDLINSARSAGLNVAHHIAVGNVIGEIISLVKSESINLLVLGADDKEYEDFTMQLKPHIPCQIVQVKEKDHIHYL
jgi:nucleotide-binding universal stress UspA family protein